VTETLTLTTEMIWVLAILGFTIYLFVSEIVPVDVAAISVMVVLGLTDLAEALFGIKPLVPVEHLFNGFSSNAVISIIAVMIIGAGLDKTGIMGRLAGVILRYGGNTEARIIPIISATVGVISSFMQNVGAAALFLPVVSRISTRTGLPMSRLLMPMGFCAILGGTVTMIGSSPLILLNDLILNSNDALPEGVTPMETFRLFDVTPVGLALVAAGIAYFVVAGRFVLPVRQSEGTEAGDTLEYFRHTYGLEGELMELRVPPESPAAGKTVADFEDLIDHSAPVVGLKTGQLVRIAPAGDTVIEPASTLALMGNRQALAQPLARLGLAVRAQPAEFAELLAPSRAGISEVVISPRSHLVGKTLQDIRMRKTYGLNVLAVYRGTGVIRENLRKLALRVGDTLVLYSTWEDLAALQKNRDFVLVTTDFPHEELRPHKVAHALAFLALALGLVLFTDLRLLVALMAGAVGMVVSGVLQIEEAYDAVSWKTVFLLASLIPLGFAVETSGTAAWIAHQTLTLLGHVPGWVLQAAVAALATFFTLVMSNVGATVLLVPLAVNIAIGAGENPAVYALTVAIATSNSFLIPTHQVNALIMGPAGYRVKDFMRAGGIMTVLFLAVALVMLNTVF
jgi:di/tricarboxylate transporter